MPCARKYQITVFLLNLVWRSLSQAEDDYAIFEKSIRPLLIEHCYKCHSATAEKIRGGLRLDTKSAMLKGGDSGPAIVPGKPEESLLIKAVRYMDKDLQMPPKGKKLADVQITELTEWVRSGAPDPRTEETTITAAKKPNYDFEAARKLWAFRPPAEPPIPKIKSTSWAKSPIDHFILAKLEEKNLHPAKAAEKRTLLRRATFDLVGLPPTREEMDDFLADHSPGAFAKVVDRLLGSPQYGERWARHWLDVVRYTDSFDARFVGSDQDSIDAWRYRDWVVSAFNRDLPYDQFITQQVAGDLLPPPAPDGINTNGIIATGMYAIGTWGNGDADKDKILTDIADDAVDVTCRAFLGLTIACARCHDHKFDPIPTADYYSLAGIFFSSHILDKLTPKGAQEALMRIPLVPKMELQSRTNRELHMADLEKQIAKVSEDEIEKLAQEFIPQAASYLRAVWELKIHDERREEGHSPAKDQSLLTLAKSRGLNEFILRRWIDFLERDPGLLPKQVKDLGGSIGLLAWKNSKGDDTPSVIYNSSDKDYPRIPAHKLAVHPAPKTGVAIVWKSPVNGLVKIGGRAADSDANCGDGIGWTITQGVKQLASGAITNGGQQSFGDETSLQGVEVAAGEMVQFTILPKADHVCDTTLIDFQITELGGQKRVWDVVKEAATDFLKQNPRPDSFGNAAVWNFIDLAAGAKGIDETNLLARYNSALRAQNPDAKNIADEIQHAIQTKADTNLYESLMAPSGAFWSPLRDDEHVFKPEIRQSIDKLRTELADLKKNPPPPLDYAHGLQEGGTPKTPHAGVHDVKIHVRGRYDRLGEIAPRRFPQVLAGDDQTPITEGSGRLQLARWLTSPENPLTARVMVNRIWQHHFGEGIVRTPNNYGKLGEPPTHPELLDFLAKEFVKSGWSMKAMHRAMMLSATYQRASANAAGSKLDPENRLFGRMNRRRLESEALRDSLLSVANRLDLTMGGPSIRDFSTNRRTLYITTIRSDRATYQFLFDAADPNAIVDRRLDSTVSPQALFLLNHPFVMAQTKVLAESVVKLEKAGEKRRIQWLYEKLYGRPPGSDEIKIGEAALSQARMEQKGKPDSESLAWEAYCQILLCANEFIYID